MPVSKVQKRAAAVAEHHPGKLFKRNRNLLSMDKKEMHEMASGSEKDMPMRAKKRKNLLRP